MLPSKVRVASRKMWRIGGLDGEASMGRDLAGEREKKNAGLDPKVQARHCD
jgi:hypothetical protein